MSITIHPLKLTSSEVEAHIEGGLSLLPGQILRFEGSASPVYGEVSGVRVVSEVGKKQSGCVARIRFLHGQADFAPQQVTILSDDQLAQEVQRLQEPLNHPVQLGGHFTGELLKLGTLTLIEGDDFILKYDALMMWVQAILPHQRVLIVDPLGVFSAGERLAYFRAGAEVRLSLQSVGYKRFLSAFGELLPESLREAALQTVASYLPATHEFIGFHQLLSNTGAAEFPLKSLILKSYEMVAQSRAFADIPDQVFDLQALTNKPLSVIDLSGLHEPWKSLFYEEIFRSLLRNAVGQFVPVLIYPESYLPTLTDWVQKANEADLNLLVTASPYASSGLKELANNRLLAETRERAWLQGELTLGLPVYLSLPESGLHTEPVHEPESMGFAEAAWSAQSAVVDLGAAQVEKGLPALAQAWEPSPTPAPPELAGPELEGMSPLWRSEAWLPEGTAAELITETGGNSFNNSNVDEEGWSNQSWSEQSKAYPGESEVAAGDFNFDLHLDQKMTGSLDTLDYGAYISEESAMFSGASGVSPSVSSSLSEFESLALPEVLPEVNRALPLPVSYEADETASEMPIEMQEPAWQESPLEASPILMDDLMEPVDIPLEAEPLEESVPVFQKSNEPESVNPANYRPGEKVRHDQYGLGVINKVLPMEESVILNITFEQVGKRLLDPALSRLTRES